MEIDGTEIGPVKDEEVLKQAEIIKEKGLRKVAVVGIYSPFDDNYRQEDHVRDLLKKILPDDVDIVCSKDGKLLFVGCFALCQRLRSW